MNTTNDLTLKDINTWVALGYTIPEVREEIKDLSPHEQFFIMGRFQQLLEEAQEEDYLANL